MENLEKHKKSLFTILNEYFLENGYEFNSIGDGKYIKETVNCQLTLGFNFSNRSNNHVNSTILIRHKIVEDFIQNLIPNEMEMEGRKLLDRFNYTLQDKENTEEIFEKRKGLNLNTKEAFEEWGNLIVDYMENEGAEFINTYSYLPNVLKKLNELEDAGEKNYLKILLGGIDHLFRALIISKLCNDTRYEAKKERFDSIILQPKYEKWHPYYLKLKEELEVTEPIYDVGL